MVAKFLRILAVFGIGLVASACTPCGDWSKFSTFPAACQSGEVK
jgi:hypothetical protein